MKEKLIKRLKSSIKWMEEDGSDMDYASWNYQEGFLLSGNEAKLFLELLEGRGGKDKTVRVSTSDRIATLGNRPGFRKQKRSYKLELIMLQFFTIFALYGYRL